LEKYIPMIFFRIGPGWVLGESFSPDVAIIELDRAVEFVPDLISPLCLPPPERIKNWSNKTLSKAFVAGWGAQRQDGLILIL